MSSYKATLVCIVIACFLAVINAEKPKSIITIKTNMSQKQQQQARDLLSTVYDQHVDENRCEQYAVGFGQLYWTTKWVTFRFPKDSAAGAYYIDPKATFIQFEVTDIDATVPVTHYLLFGVKKYL